MDKYFTKIFKIFKIVKIDKKRHRVSYNYDNTVFFIYPHMKGVGDKYESPVKPNKK